MTISDMGYTKEVMAIIKESYQRGKLDATYENGIRIEKNQFDNGYRIGVSDTIEKCKEIVKEDCTKNCAHDYKCIDCLCYQFEQLKEQK